MGKKPQRRKYKIIREESYSYLSFSFSKTDKRKLFKLPNEIFGDVCEKRIAEPILAKTFQVYKPEMLIQKAWDRSYFEMLKLYKKHYKKPFKKDRHFLINTFLSPFGISFKENRDLLTNDLLPRRLFTNKEINNKYFPDFLSDRVIEKKLRTEIECFVHFWANRFWVSSDPDLGRQYRILTPWEKIVLCELVRRNLRPRRRGMIPDKLEKMMIGDIYKAYGKVVLDHLPSTPAKDISLLRQCLSSYSTKEDFFCVSKSKSRFEKPFYFVEVKGERVKANHPTFTLSQKEFFHQFKGKVGILILRIFLAQNKIEVKWLIPNSES